MASKPRGRPKKNAAQPPTAASPGDKQEAASATDDISLASLAPAPAAPPPEKGEGSKRGAARGAGVDDEATLSSLAPKKKLEGQRPRYGKQLSVEDAVPGWQPTAPDPEQRGEVQQRQSTEITRLSTNNPVFGPPPIAKEERGKYVWAVKTSPTGEDKSRTVYTFNPDDMEPVQNYAEKEQNVCDVCGGAATEVLFEFRCFERRRDYEMANATGRKLHPFISYISKKCGADLLGKQSAESSFREMVYRVILAPNADEQLEKMWQMASPKERQILQNEVSHFAGVHSGMRSGVDLELRKAEDQRAWQTGKLKREPEDPFRIMSRATAPALQLREVAALTVLTAGDKVQEGSFLSAVQKCLVEGLALPPPPGNWQKNDVEDCLTHLTSAWPLNVVLHSALGGTQEYQCKAGASAPTIKMVYLDGCQSLHGPVLQKVEKAEISEMKRASADQLQGAFPAVAVPKTGSFVGRAQDRSLVVPEDPNEVDIPLVTKALTELEWPDCTSRNNVKPDGQDTIKAMCLGMVKPYFAAVTASRRTRLLPNVTKLCTQLSKHIPQQVDGPFRYTSIQLNLDYNAKMHVDKNNHGPSYIIGLGDFSGGGLWIYDPAGTVFQKVTDKLQGYPHLEVNAMIPGHVHNIKENWLKFDGTIPHMALDFKGKRISIVYFSRKGSLDVEPEAEGFLKSLGFPLPDLNWLNNNLPTQGAASPAVKAARQMVAPQIEVDPVDSDDDEVDEDLEMSKQADAEEGLITHARASGWARSFRERLGAAAWEHIPVRLGVVACCAGPGPAAAVALQELLPMGGAEALCVADEGNEAAVTLARQNVRPSRLFKTLAEFEKGEGFCEAEHKEKQKLPDAAKEHLFCACFCAGPLLNPKKMADDVSLRPLKLARAHLAARRTPLALLEVSDWSDHVPARQQKEVLELILGTSEPWGLRSASLKDYDVEILEMRLEESGASVEGSRLYILLARKDVASAKELKSAARIARWLAGELPRTTTQELLHDGGSDVKGVRATKSARGRQEPEKWAAGTYTKLLRGLQNNPLEWWSRASAHEQKGLNKVHAQAGHSGLDVQSLLLDLTQNVTKQPWRDNGLLPGATSGRHYSFLKHRPLSGCEELLCRGYPTHLRMRGAKDEELCRLAAGAPVVQATAACISALVAVARLQLQSQRGGAARSLQLSAPQLVELLARVPPLPAGARSAENLDGGAEAAEADSGSVVSSRAVALLNLLARHDLAVEGDAAPTSKEEQKALKVLKQAADNAPEGLDAPIIAMERLPAEPEVPAGKETEEPRTWEVRLRKLNTWQIQNPPIKASWAMKWVTEAARDIGHASAHDIISLGCGYLKACCGDKQAGKSGKVPDRADYALKGVSELTDDFKDALSRVGFETAAREMEELVWNTLFLIGLKQNDGNDNCMITKKMIETGRLKEFFQQRVSRLTAWPTVREFLKHLCKTIQDKPDLKLPEKLHQQNLFPVVLGLLKRLPDPSSKAWMQDKGWSEGNAVAKVLLKSRTGYIPHLHSTLLGLVDRVFPEHQKPLEDEVYEAMVHLVRAKVEKKSGVTAVLEDFAEGGGKLAERFKQGLACQKEFEEIRRQLGTAQPGGDRRVELWEALSGTAHEAKNRVVAVSKSAEQQMGAKSRKALQELLSLENSQWTEDIGKLENTRSLASSLKLKDKQEAEERELKVRRLKEMEKATESTKAAHLAIEHLRDALDLRSWRLLEENQEGFEELIRRTSQVLKAKKAVTDSGARDLITDIDATMEIAHTAARHHCQKGARRAAAKRKLVDLRLGHAVALLEGGHVLDRLTELRANSEALLDGLGLPHSARQRLEAMAQKGELREDRLQPTLPRGFQSKASSSIGLEYVVFTQSNRTQWDWPFEEPEAWSPHLPPPPVGFSGEAPTLDFAPYVVQRDGETYCLLCGNVQASREHMRSNLHQQALQRWNSMADYVAGLPEALQQAVRGQTGSVPGLLQAWKGDVLLVLPEKGGKTLSAIAWYTVLQWHLSSVSDSVEALDRELVSAGNMMRLPEPRQGEYQNPSPGLDFPCYPAETEATRRLNDESPYEAIFQLSPAELLGTGIEILPSGEVRCGFCEVGPFDPEKLKTHLHPSHKDAKQHRRYSDHSRSALNSLRIQGWRFEAEGVILNAKQYTCLCKEGERTEHWLSVFEHLSTAKHTKWKATSRPDGELTKAEEETFRSHFVPAMKESCDRHMEALEEAQVRNGGRYLDIVREKGLAKPAEQPPAKAAQAATQEAPEAKRAKVAPPVQEEPLRTMEEPPLPVPNKDFPILFPGTSGIERKANGAVFCHFCDMEVKGDEAAHLASRRHVGYSDVAIKASKMVCETGDRLWREGITIADHKFECKPCQKSGAWWDVYQEPPHASTQKHIKFRNSSEFAQVPTMPWEDERAQRWRASVEQASASAKPLGAKAEDDDPAPTPPKKLKTEQSPRTANIVQAVPKGSAGAPVASAPSASSSSPSAAADGEPNRVPSGAQGYPAPSRDEIADAQKAAANRYAAPLPPGLEWGYADTKRKQLYVFCPSCRQYCDVMLFNLPQGKFEPEGGACPHWTKPVREKYYAAMRAVVQQHGGGHW